MKFSLPHTFDCDPATLWSITDDPEFERRLGERSDTGRELLDERIDGGVRYVRRRITANRELPAAMKKVLGSDQITYTQETWRPVDGNELRWKITPMVLAGKFTGEGTTTVTAIPTGCRRIIAGELRIAVPLIGAKMEQKLVDDVRASYEKAAVILREMLAERG